jgi:hypothetical protein
VSMDEILTTADELLKDDALGLSARVLDLAAGDASVRADFAFGKWALAGTMNDTRSPNLMLRPGTWSATAKRSDLGHRDARGQIVLGYEFFGADPLAIQRNVALLATAIAQVIDQLVDYSVATGGTIYEVEDPIDFAFGQFAGPTSNGLIATITVLERSTV